ncbi:hypothetical protein Tco_1260176 [Tanacetum coccineum]
MLVEFVIQNQFFSLTLEEFGQILGIPFEGHCSFFDKCSLNNLESSVPTSGPYQTNPPSPNEIKLYVQVEREDVVTRIRHDQVIDVEENQILTREITPIMKTWVNIIRENVFCLGGNRDHVSACLCHMLYCIATSTKYNLLFFIAKRMEFVTKQARLILPYGMLLTRLFDHVMYENLELSNDQRVLCLVRSCHVSSYRSTRAKDSKGLWHEKRSSLYFLFLRLRSTILLSSQR